MLVRIGSPSIGQGLRALGAWAIVLLAGTYLYLFEPGRTGFFPACPFHALTGWNCPGCGTTRGLHQLLHGNLVAAFELNPLIVVMVPILGYALIANTRAAISGRPMPRLSLAPKYGWLLTGLLLGFWVFRNTPLYPFPS